jgi:hypothetical protein
VDLSPAPRHLAIAGELGYFGTAEDASSVYVLVPRASLHFAFDERWSIAGDWGVIAIDSVPEHGTADQVLRSGNPSVFGLLSGAHGELRYRVAIGATVPLAGIDRAGQGRLQHVAFNDAQAIDGLWNVWLWAPSRAAAIAFGRIDLPLHPDLALELVASPALLIPVFGAYGHEATTVFIPTALGFNSHKGPFRFGLRLQAVFMPSNNVDKLQLALVPWLRLLLGSAFVEARYVGNLDEPLAGERGPRIWGLHLAGGGSL